MRTQKVIKSDDEWRTALTEEQYNVLRKKDTETPFTGEYWSTKEKGIYLCAACGAELFSSDTKFDSKSGWPSFYAPITRTTKRPLSLPLHGGGEMSVELKSDASLGMERTEVACNRCGGHLGHVFQDGPKPTGKRYCINSTALKLKKK